MIPLTHPPRRWLILTAVLLAWRLFGFNFAALTGSHGGMSGKAPQVGALILVSHTVAVAPPPNLGLHTLVTSERLPMSTDDYIGLPAEVRP